MHKTAQEQKRDCLQKPHTKHELPPAKGGMEKQTLRVG